MTWLLRRRVLSGGSSKEEKLKSTAPSEKNDFPRGRPLTSYTLPTTRLRFPPQTILQMKGGPIYLALFTNIEMFLIGCLTSSYIALQKVTPRGAVLKINPSQGLAWPHGGHCVRPSTPENHSGWVGAGGRWGRRTSHLRFLTVGSSCCTRSHESQAVLTTSAFFSQGSQVHSIPTTPKRKRGPVFTHSFIFRTFLLGQLSSTRAPSGIHFTPTFPLARPRAPSQLSGGRASPFSAGSGVGGGVCGMSSQVSQLSGR